MTNKELLEKVETAIYAVHECGARPHIRLTRYRNAIKKLIWWEHRLRVAQNSVDLYSRRKRMYERWMTYHEESK